jgi:hypothetical protein
VWSKIVAAVVPVGTRKRLTNVVAHHVQAGAQVYTDSHPGYHMLHEEYLQAMIDHAKAYVRGRVQTNGLENFWSPLKRTLSGTYVSVDAPHLDPLCR